MHLDGRADAPEVRLHSNDYEHWGNPFLVDQAGKLPALRPDPRAYRNDAGGYAEACAWAHELVVAEVVLRRCRAHRLDGRPYTARLDSGIPVVDERQRLVSVETPGKPPGYAGTDHSDWVPAPAPPAP